MTTSNSTGLRTTSTLPPRPTARPVEVTGAERGVRTTRPRVAAVIVTWNRHAAVDVVLRALAGQRLPEGTLDVVVVDNGSTDGTVEFLRRQWRPDVMVGNPTERAEEPAFRVESGAAGLNGALHHAVDGAANGTANGTHAEAAGSREADRCAFDTLTVIRNLHNLGGCGGFNTGLAYLEAFMDPAGGPLDYAWLVDDDIDLPDNALAQLLATAESDATIGLVGSRTVDFQDRETTIETTIYFDHETGLMGPDPVSAHRQHAAHARWVETTGGTRGKLDFSGVREVDVVSACSLLARWSAVKKVGFWDARYFIYCDDADWCLRFPAAGYRVVLDLDAVVYHTYWLSKLTPVRGYYAQRNLLWLIQKNFAGRVLRRLTMRRLAALLLESRKAMMHCRLFHAEIIRRTAEDVVTGRGGRLDDEGPAFIPLLEAFEKAGALAPGATVLVMCSHTESVRWADELRARMHYALMDAGRGAERPRWVYMVRSDVHDPELELPARTEHECAERIVFEPNRGSKWAAQQPFLHEPPTATVIFDQHNDFPMLRSRANIHIDRRRAGVAQLEMDGLGARLKFLRRWAGTALRCLKYGATVRPYARRGKYG